MQSFGAYLKDERESRKISLDEISRATKIRRAILEAIEQDQGETLLPEAVVKGFIRTYARHIGLDPKEVMATYAEKQRGDETPVKERPRPDGKHRLPAKYVFAGGICVLIIVIIPLLFFSFSERGPREGSQEVVLTTPITEQITMVSSEDMQASPSLPSGEEPIPLQTDTAGVEEVEEVKKEEVQDVQEAAPEVSEVDAGIEAGEDVVAVQEEEPMPVSDHTLVITASERTWIQIKEGSSLPFDVILFPGDSFTRTSSQQLAVVIGNAGGVTVSFDGEKMGSPGKVGEVVRLTLPSPEEG